MDKKKLRRVPMYIALAAALPIAIGACSSSGSSTSDPATSTSAPQAAGGPVATSTAQAGVAQFALCMRQNGVTNFPDPTNGHFVMGPDIQSNPHFQTAIQACQHLLGASGISGGSNGPQQSARLKFAHCMQTSGVPSFPDPTAGGAIVTPSGVDRNSATYKNAFNKCKADLPNGGAGLG
jgi:hypothetical protein